MVRAHSWLRARSALPVAAATRADKASTAGWLTIAEADKASLLMLAPLATMMQALQLSSRR